MRGELKDKVARGVAWSLGERVGTMLLSMGVRLVILRLLTREILGYMAIPTAIVTVALVLVDSGFSQNLIRRKEPSQEDYKSVFVFNIVVALLLYVLAVATAPWLARYYAMPDITRIAPVFFLLLPISALCVIQNAIFSRQFRFALLSKATFFASFVSGLVAIGLALAGFGIWTLVIERLISVIVRTGLLWWFSDWRPCGKCRIEPLRQMAPFSMSLLATDLISAFYTKIPQFFLGRLYPADTLGSFEQAVKLKDMPSVSAVSAVQGVTFPALSKIRDDAPKFAEGYRQIVMIVAYAMFPMMLGLSAVAYDLFAVLLGEEWMPTVPYFEAVCLAGLFYPISAISYNVLKVMSDGRIIVRLEIVKKLLMTVVFAVTISHSVQAVVWGLVVISFCEMVINFIAARRFTTLTTLRFLRTLLPAAAISCVMYVVVRLVTAMMPDATMLRLMTEIAAGCVTYLLLSALFRLAAFREVITLIRKQIR